MSGTPGGHGDRSRGNKGEIRGAKARGEMGAGSRGSLWTLVAAWSRWEETHGSHQWSPGLLLFHLLHQCSSESLPQPPEGTGLSVPLTVGRS